MTTPDELQRAVERPAWMHKNFRYPPSSPEAVAARALCVPGPDWVPNLQAENRRMVAERAELLATVERMRGGLETISKRAGQLFERSEKLRSHDARAVRRIADFADAEARAALTTGEEK